MSLVQCPECNGDVSDQAVICPHCGYPLKHKETQNEEYVLSKGPATGSGFATFLRVIAWISWVGGLIISIAGVSSYRYQASSSVVTFLTLFLSYFIYGVLFMCLATVVDQVSATYSIVSGIMLEKRKQEQKSISNSTSKQSYVTDLSGGGGWTCPNCRYSNKSWDDYCKSCGEPKRKAQDKKVGVFFPK